MAVRIRLQRHGSKKRPFYRLVATDARNKRDGRFNELLGVYNPRANPQVVDFKMERIEYWLGVGASPSDTAKRLIDRARKGGEDLIGLRSYEKLNGERLKARREAAYKVEAYKAPVADAAPAAVTTPAAEAAAESPVAEEAPAAEQAEAPAES